MLGRRRRLIRGSLAAGGAILLYEKPTLTRLGPIAALAISGDTPATPVLGPVPPRATAPTQERPGLLPSSGETVIAGPVASVAAGLGLIAAGVGFWLRSRRGGVRKVAYGNVDSRTLSEG